VNRVEQTNVNALSAAEAGRRIAGGKLTSEALLRACLKRIEARESEIHAWAYLDPELALKQARDRDRERPRSPLHGVPVGIKDVIDTADMPTACNSPIYSGRRPIADAACVALLRNAGCVILGKTVTTEFATMHPAATRNPHNLRHTPGGSSSGSAAAVADCMVPIGFGTQTGGSTIRPAAFCGIVGYKPTYNLINRAGLKFVAESLDTIGVLTRSVEDAALTVSVVSGLELPPARTSAPRIGLCRTPKWREADAATQAELERVAGLLAKAGAQVRELEIPEGGESLFDEHDVISGYESVRALAWEYANHAAQMSESLRSRLEDGSKVTRAEYERARQRVRRVRRQLAVQMRECDFLLTPSATGEAPEGLKSTGNAVFNRAWTALGMPCVTLPCGKGPRGLPLGVQVVAPRFGDRDLLAWARWAETRIT
jgi:Asp-tRNA(Asn)/Glu-tRNA(Gln) amidotransferase A subunit family amidase